ncbi:hypothetical protein TCAL_17372 [Tigriopus californicus]|uniref:Cytochrome P450 n=1 Tax=Tigriopus californicus TaxID=6832 RepID=A0A553PHU9_TIGCA|nr:cytochrome P450 2J4-like [Tigriopus californicus]TRY77256.1 hypothetical protein TCAL_17372 [Tigriopus californicus]|eukprot:TCALIF_02023-PA protein Name:"Similar to Cyp2j3 Cytochrome P450 2J3 (Rattus norvegicus)" AED:0.01 eAED:0.01 QI:0/-1/0/1/-1/1/1/0/491
MLSSYLLLFTVALVASNFIYKFAHKYRNLPPGPLGVPILGYLPFLDVSNLGEAFKNIAKTYGDIFSLRVGTEMAVVLNSYESIKAAFSKTELCARPNTFMFRFFSQGENGIASTSGEKWEVQRKFTHSNLKALGFGQNKMESFIKDEIHDLIELLEEKSKGGQPVEIGYDINVSIVNVIWALITGERKPHHDQKLRDFLTSVNKGIELASTSGILLFMPFLVKIFPESMFGIDKMRKWMKHSYSYLQEVIDEHKVNHTDVSSNQDFIDAFLSEMKKDGAHPSFNEFQLLVLCSELFGAGGEPTSVTLKWALRFLALNPHVQAKAQAEIQQVVGNNRMVDLEDRPNLPYVQAMIHEIIRFSDIHPIGVMHSPSEDTELEGFKLPKGTFIFPNFHAVHRDPRHWEKPEELYPEHWLDANGQFVPNHDGFIAFGAGKRKCPGQEVAQMELFSFVANLIQKFNFSLPASDCGTLETSMGCVVSPKPYDLVLEARY